MNIEFVNTVDINPLSLQYFVSFKVFTKLSTIVHRYETIDGKSHNIYDSATSFYTSSGELMIVYYSINHLPHRLYKPAEIRFSRNQVDSELYFINGQMHNEYGPAALYYNDGKLANVSYWKHNRQHNEHGPADIHYDADGNELFTRHFINGMRQHNNTMLDFSEDKIMHYFESLPPLTCTGMDLKQYQH